VLLNKILKAFSPPEERQAFEVSQGLFLIEPVSFSTLPDYDVFF